MKRRTLALITSLFLFIGMLPSIPAASQEIEPPPLIILENSVDLQHQSLINLSIAEDPSPIDPSPGVPAGFLLKEADKESIEPGETITYTITIGNNIPVTTTYSLTDTLPVDGTCITETITGGLAYDIADHTLTGEVILEPYTMSVKTEAGGFPYYISLENIGGSFVPCPDIDCDDTAVILEGLDFFFNGEHITDASWHIDGYLALNTSSIFTDTINQNFPDPTTPNNVLAPMWSDFDLDGGDGVGSGIMYRARLTDGVYDYTVLEWENVLVKNGDQTFTFQIWIKEHTDSIWFVYGPYTPIDSIPDAATIGVENIIGTIGDTYYYDTAGIFPQSGSTLQVSTLPKEIFTYQMQAGTVGDLDFTNTIEASNDANEYWISDSVTAYINPNRVNIPVIYH